MGINYSDLSSEAIAHIHDSMFKRQLEYRVKLLEKAIYLITNVASLSATKENRELFPGLYNAIDEARELIKDK